MALPSNTKVARLRKRVEDGLIRTPVGKVFQHRRDNRLHSRDWLGFDLESEDMRVDSWVSADGTVRGLSIGFYATDQRKEWARAFRVQDNGRGGWTLLRDSGWLENDTRDDYPADEQR